MRVRFLGFALLGMLSTGLAACHSGSIGGPKPSPTPSGCVSGTPPPGALTVTSTADSGAGSLRDTLASASPNAVIVFASPLAGETISVSSAPLTISSAVTVSGPCSGVTLAGSASGGNALVNVASGTTAILNNLTVTSTGVTALALGFSSAVSASNLSIVGSVANSCAALNIPTTATISIEFGAISNNKSSAGDGIICDAGVFDATNMSFSQNTTSGAGVLDALPNGKATVEQSEFDGNKAGGNGGALSMNGGSGSVINTTFYANSSGGSGGAVYVGTMGTLLLNFNTIAGNTATPAQVTSDAPPPALVLHNNIIDTLVGTVDVSGSFTSEGYNFVYNTGFTNGWQGSDLLHLPLSLYPFGNYGGPTSSLPPEAGARVISAADPANGFPPTDQRGISRPQGPQPCIGSIEYNPSKPP